MIIERVCTRTSFSFCLFGPGLDLKLHPGVRSSRNSMKVLTARIDVSYLRDYKTGGEEGYAGRFLCLQGLFVFSATLPLLYHQCIAFVFLLGYAGLPLVLRVLNAPALFSASSPWHLAGYIYAGSGWLTYAVMHESLKRFARFPCFV